MALLLIAFGIVALLLGLHVAAVFAEKRGWIYYRTRPPRVRMLGLFDELVDPGVEYRIEEETSEAIRSIQSEQGEGYGDMDGSD